MKATGACCITGASIWLRWHCSSGSKVLCTPTKEDLEWVVLRLSRNPSPTDEPTP
jgi:hypothetical protein